MTPKEQEAEASRVAALGLSTKADSGTNTNPSTSTLADLLVRVEKAEGPDRELDAAISRALNLWRIHLGAIEMLLADAFTGSLDSSLALLKAALPGARAIITHEPDSYSAVELLIGWNRRETHLGGAERADGETPLAVCAALLKALIAKVEGDRLSRNQPCGRASADAEVSAGLDVGGPAS